MSRAWVFLFAVCIACGDGRDPSGTYVLAAIEGEPLPWTFPTVGATYLSGTLIIRADGTFTDAIQWEGDGANVRVSAESGTWTRDGSLVHLSYDTGGTNCPMQSGFCASGLYEARLLPGGTLSKTRIEALFLIYQRQ